MTDNTTAKRQANRRRLLNQAAQSLGFSSWGKLETAVIRDQIILSVRWMEPDDTEHSGDILTQNTGSGML